MNATTDKVLTALIPAAAFGLNILCPAVPAIVWSALLNAVINGDITLQHIEDFMAAHNIKTYYADTDFPAGRNGA